MAVEVGAEFRTYDELTHAIRVYEAENFVNLIIRDTRTVEAASKRNQRKKYNPAIKYSDISYCCTYGGKKYVCHSTGKRNHKTIKQSCPFSLKVRATVDGQSLFVREMCPNHNHQLTEAEFRLHPKQRKLDIGSQEEIANLLSMEPDKKLLREKLMQITGKVILMKDIHNIKTRLLNPKAKTGESKKGVIEKEFGDVIVQARDDIKVDESLNLEAKVEQDEVSEEIHIPISHVASSHLDTCHQQSMIIQHSDQQVDTNAQQCYIENQTYQHHPPSVVYSGNLQPFQPAQVYSMVPQAFPGTSPSLSNSDVVHSMQQIEPNMGGSQHYQHWTALNDVGHHNMQEPSYQTLTSFSYHGQQNSSHSAHQEPQHHVIPVPTSQPLQPSLVENTSPPTRRTPELLSHHGAKQTRRRQAVSSRKRKQSAVQADKDTLMKKYFQQATVNLFFNERLKSPGSKFFKTLRSRSTGAKMSEDRTDVKFHEMLKPLAWLFGKWRSTEGKGIYPNIQDFTYGEEVVFQPLGMKPIVEYKMYSWKLDNNIPLHRETGFIRINPTSNCIAFVAAHTMGVVEVQEGEVNGQELTVETKTIGRASFNPPPEVKLVRRNLRRKEGGELEQVVHMQTDKTELTEHLRITYKKAE